MQGWVAARLPIETLPQWDVHRLREQITQQSLQVLDVRSDSEWQDGHIDPALHIGLDQLADRTSTLDRHVPVAVVCGSGNRSSIAASILRRRGFKSVANVVGGMGAWKAAGYPTAR